MSGAFERELGQLAGVRGRLRVARAWLWWCAGLAAGVAVLGAIDAWVETPAWARIVALVVMGASWARMVFWSARTLARAGSGPGLGEAARLADARLGLAGRRLQGAFELGRPGVHGHGEHGGSGDDDVGAALRARAADKALEALRERGGVTRVLAADRRGAWRAAGAVLGVCAIVAACVAWWPEPARAWWLRLAEPTGDHPPFGATRLLLSAEPMPVRQGDAVRVRAQASGAEPERVWLDVQNERGAPAGGVARVEMARREESHGAIGASSGAVFEAVLPELAGPVRVTARCQRGRSVALRLEPVARAAVESAWIVAEAPAGIEPARVVFDGTSAASGTGEPWRAEAEVFEGDRLVLGIATGGPAWRAVAAPGEAAWTREGGALVRRIGPVNAGTFEWVTDVEDGSAQPGARVDMSARVRADLAPTLTIEAMAAGPAWLPEDGAMVVRAHAADDRGLGACGWSWALLDESRQLVAMGAQRTDEGEPAKAQRLEAVISAAAVGARAGEVLLVWFHAAELSGRAGGPRWAAASALKIEVVEPDGAGESGDGMLAMSGGAAGTQAGALAQGGAELASGASGELDGSWAQPTAPVGAEQRAGESEAAGADAAASASMESQPAAGASASAGDERAGVGGPEDGRLVRGAGESARGAGPREDVAMKAAPTRARRFVIGPDSTSDGREANTGVGPRASAQSLPLDAPPRQREIVERYLQILREGESAARKETAP